jgi:membrane associated rhomboid family serine protease
MKVEKIQFILILIALLWIVFVLDMLLPIQLNSYGIVPRTGQGLIGIATSPFLHNNFPHLLGNTVPLLILCSLLVSVYDRIAFQVLAIVMVVGGSLVWLMGRTANHIGASGIIYGVAAFLIMYGLMKKKVVSILVAAAVAFLYGGSMFAGVLPVNPGVSWEGHLFSAMAGIFAAFFIDKRTARG